MLFSIEVSSFLSVIRTAISHRLRIFCVFSIRNAPSCDVSSSPAVSRNVTGPIGKSSIDFSTTSVVVPAVSETIDIAWFVILFRNEDFPTLVLPKSPMCRRNDFNAFIEFS